MRSKTLSLMANLEINEFPVFILMSILGNVCRCSSTLSEFELSRLKERQSEGIAKAKLKNVYAGRSAGSNETSEVFLNKPKTKEIQKYLKAGESVRRTAKLSGASISLVQKVIKLTTK